MCTLADLINILEDVAYSRVFIITSAHLFNNRESADS
jgi:hypothetical protein